MHHLPSQPPLPDPAATTAPTSRADPHAPAAFPAAAPNPARAESATATAATPPMPQSLVPFPGLPPLSRVHQDLLHALIQHNQDFRALAAATGRPIFDLYAWAASPDIAPWLKLHRTLSAHADRAAALAALRHAMETSDSPIEQRRAAVAILRAHAPTRRPRSTPAIAPGSTPGPSAPTFNVAPPAPEPDSESDDPDVDPDEPDIDDDSPDLDTDDPDTDDTDSSHLTDDLGAEPPKHTAPELTPPHADPHTGPRPPQHPATEQPGPLPASPAAADAYPPILYPDKLDEYSVFPPDFIPGRHPLAPKPPPTDTPSTLESDSS